VRIDALLAALRDRGGSDLHLHEDHGARFRIHGRLEPFPAPEGEAIDVRALVAEVLDDRRRGIFERDGEVDLAHAVPGVGRFRVNAFRYHGGIGAIFRRIPERIPSLEELSIPPEAERFTHASSGLVLVTGPTGSGKSSTLAALIDLVNARERRHIVTIEDPIEYAHGDRLSTVTQREVGADTDSFATALRSAARQDPDLVLVGEMRDLETIRLALTLAEMGMLVFSTVHTNSAPRTVDRIVEVFPEEQQSQVRAMLADSLQGVLSQLLCRRTDGSGMVPSTELLFTSTALRSAIREGASHKIESMIKAGRSEGMHTMDDSLWRLAEEGTISGDEAYRKANDKARFLRFAGG